MEKGNEAKKMLMKPDMCWYPIDESYRMDVLEVVGKVGSKQNEEIERVRMVLSSKKTTKEYLLKKSKDKKIKASYLQ